MILSVTHRLLSSKSAASMSSVIQWNILGLQASREELNMFLSDVDSTVVLFVHLETSCKNGMCVCLCVWLVSNQHFYETSFISKLAL